MAIVHNVNVDDDDANWLRWGNLVFDWVTNAGNRPNTVAELRAAMAAAGVAGSVKGADNRRVQIFPYPETGPILIPLPTKPMVDADRTELARIAALPNGQKHYPTPKFYGLIYGSAAKVDFTLPQLQDMAKRRIGEYVINECM